MARRRAAPRDRRRARVERAVLELFEALLDAAVHGDVAAAATLLGLLCGRPRA